MPSFRKPALAVLTAAVLVLTGCGDTTSAPPAAPGDAQPGTAGQKADTRTHQRGDAADPRQVVDAWSDAQLAGGVLVVTYEGTGPAAAARPVTTLHAAGVIVMGYNVTSADQVQATTAAVQQAARRDGRDHLPVIGVDQEGGTVARLGGVVSELPAFMSAGAAIRGNGADGEGVVTDASRAAGRQLRALGFTWVFAPVADVTLGPSDPTIGSRSASDDPQLAAAAVRAAVTGYRDGGIVPVAKHWPGHGSVTTDSHLDLPVQDASLAALRRRDFVPFRAASEAEVPVMMMSHIAYSGYEAGTPSTLAPKAYASLRAETGFTGLVVTDAMNMKAVDDRYPAGEAAVRALAAGADVVLMPTDATAAHQAIVAALRDGTLDRDEVRASAARVVDLQTRQRAPRATLAEADRDLEKQSRALSAAAITQVSGRCEAPVDDAVRVTGGSDAQRAAFASAAREAGLRTDSGPTVTLVPRSGATGALSVALDTPYTLGASSGTGYALYGDDGAAFDALMDVLTGKRRPRGELPVTVAGADPPRC